VRSRLLGVVSSVSPWPNILSHRVIENTTLSSFSWCCKWWYLVNCLSLVVVSFFFFLIFSLPAKVHIKPLFDCFSILILMFSIAYFNTWPFWKTFWSFQFHSWITICHVLLFSILSLFFWFPIYFPSSFVKVLLFSISSLNQSSFYFFSFNLTLTLLIFFLLKFFLFNLTL